MEVKKWAKTNLEWLRISLKQGIFLSFICASFNEFPFLFSLVFVADPCRFFYLSSYPGYVLLCLACDLNFWEFLLPRLGWLMLLCCFFCSRRRWVASLAASSGSPLFAFSNSDLFTTKKWQGRPWEKFGWVIMYCRPLIGLTSPFSLTYLS